MVFEQDVRALERIQNTFQKHYAIGRSQHKIYWKICISTRTRILLNHRPKLFDLIVFKYWVLSEYKTQTDDPASLVIN